MTNRTPERLEALGSILGSGLSYSWFVVDELDTDAVTATIRTENYNEGPVGEYTIVHQVTADDVARGLRLYREYLEGTQEAYPGEFKFRAEDAVRAGVIASEDEFVPAEHNRADAKAYGWKMVEFDRTNGAEGDYDANTADSVMQFAVFGYTIYS